MQPTNIKIMFNKKIETIIWILCNNNPDKITNLISLTL